MSTKTTLTPVNEIQHDWYVVDAADQRLGRLATEIAQVIRGKKKPNYTPHMDIGDFVIVVNADKVV
ncbi:MAG: uL13 family ribosomal protein, partial [Phormidesmis sp.]